MIFQGFNESYTGVVSTPLQSSLCGVWLSPNKQYLLAGAVRGAGELSVGLCGGVYDYDGLTEYQKTNLESWIDNDPCTCEVRI